MGELVSKYIDENPELHDFGKVLMRDVRDRSHLALRDIVAGTARAPGLRDLSERVSQWSSDDRDAALRLGEQMIDQVLCSFFAMLGDHSEDITLTAFGKDVYEVSDGLGGELYGDEGWIHRFSEFPSRI